MTYDYECRCGRSEERNVRLADRDLQKCGTCGGRMLRLPHYRHVKVNIPLWFRAGHDESTYLPDKVEERQEFQEAAYREHGRWRSDLGGTKPKGHF